MNLMYSAEPTQEEWDERKAIIDAANEKGYVTKKQADWLLKFDQKYRRCNRCGRSLDESHGWILATAPDRHGKDLNIGLMACCWECMHEDIMEQRKGNEHGEKETQ